MGNKKKGQVEEGQGPCDGFEEEHDEKGAVPEIIEPEVADAESEPIHALLTEDGDLDLEDMREHLESRVEPGRLEAALQIVGHYNALRKVARDANLPILLCIDLPGIIDFMEIYDMHLLEALGRMRGHVMSLIREGMGDAIKALEDQGALSEDEMEEADEEAVARQKEEDLRVLLGDDFEGLFVEGDFDT